jgi:elongation factor 3
MSPAAVNMANTHATPLPPSIYEPQLIALAKAASALEAKSVADAICLQIKKTAQPLQAVLDASIVDVVLIWAGSKSGYERESAGVLIERLCKTLGEGIEGVFLPLLPALLNLMMDKGQPVRSAIQGAVNALIKICPPESTRQVLEILGAALNECKGWRSKVAALKAMEGMVRAGEDGEWVAMEFGHIIPSVEHAMHDTKSEVSARLSENFADVSRFHLPLSRLLPLFAPLFPTPICSLTSSFLFPPWRPPPPFPAPSRLCPLPRLWLKSTRRLLPSWSLF